jgi:hypothetical protein
VYLVAYCIKSPPTLPGSSWTLFRLDHDDLRNGVHPLMHPPLVPGSAATASTVAASPGDDDVDNFDAVACSCS